MPSRRDFCQLMLASTAALPALSLASAGTALAQTRANTLRVVWPYDTASLDAVGIGAQRSTWCISLHIYDRLVTYAVTSRPDGTHEYDPAKPTGELAERWDMSPDSKTITFHLRAGDMIAGTWVVIEPKPVLLPDLAEARRGQQSAPEETYRFTEPQLVVYGVKELQVLEEVLRSAGAEQGAVRRDVAQRIARKIGYSLPNPQDQEATRFLEAFYAAQRRRLETELTFGRRRRDKNDR